MNDRRSVIFDSLGKPIQLGGVATDITEKKSLLEQLRLKNYALDNSSSAISIGDLGGIIFYVNDDL